MTENDPYDVNSTIGPRGQWVNSFVFFDMIKLTQSAMIYSLVGNL